MNFGKWLMIAGAALLIIGFLFWFGGKMGLPLGKLPGDISIKGEKVRFYFPIVTSIILSILLTIFINIIIRIFRK